MVIGKDRIILLKLKLLPFAECDTHNKRRMGFWEVFAGRRRKMRRHMCVCVVWSRNQQSILTFLPSSHRTNSIKKKKNRKRYPTM